jgi:hypothetical protein
VLLLHQCVVDDLAIRFSHTDFTANHNWVERFKQRRGIVSRSINGESAAVDETVVEDYVSTTLPNFLRDYDSKDVFNIVANASLIDFK